MIQQLHYTPHLHGFLSVIFWNHNVKKKEIYLVYLTPDTVVLVVMVRMVLGMSVSGWTTCCQWQPAHIDHAHWWCLHVVSHVSLCAMSSQQRERITYRVSWRISPFFGGGGSWRTLGRGNRREGGSGMGVTYPPTKQKLSIWKKSEKWECMLSLTDPW